MGEPTLKIKITSGDNIFMNTAILSSKETGFIQTVGRRKSSVATISFFPGKGKIVINGKPAAIYTQADDRAMYLIPLPFKLIYNKLFLDNFDVHVKVKGGGITGQAKAIQLGIARGLLLINPVLHKASEVRSILKTENLLTRDSRRKERKKYGLKKARKAPQFSKR